MRQRSLTPGVRPGCNSLVAPTSSNASTNVRRQTRPSSRSPEPSDWTDSFGRHWQIGRNEIAERLGYSGSPAIQKRSSAHRISASETRRSDWSHRAVSSRS